MADEATFRDYRDIRFTRTQFVSALNNPTVASCLETLFVAVRKWREEMGGDLAFATTGEMALVCAHQLALNAIDVFVKDQEKETSNA